MIQMCVWIIYFYLKINYIVTSVPSLLSFITPAKGKRVCLCLEELADAFQSFTFYAIRKKLNFGNKPSWNLRSHHH